MFLDYSPLDWTQEEVRDWVLQYIQQYNPQYLEMTDFDMTGNQLCQLTKEQFCQKAGKNVGEMMFEDIIERKNDKGNSMMFC